LSGKDHYLGPYGTSESRATYDGLLAEWSANHRRLTHPDRDPIVHTSMDALMDAYEEDAGIS
jgi:hypothetical protein